MTKANTIRTIGLVVWAAYWTFVCHVTLGKFPYAAFPIALSALGTLVGGLMMLEELESHDKD